MASAGDDVDRISALPDDLLHLILGLVCDAKSVVRTAALSRRWRRVWIYARQLALLGTGRPRFDPCCHFVDSVLAQRGDADIESLNISMPLRSSLVYISPEKPNGWLRYAMQRVVKSFRLVLPLPLQVDHGPAVVLLPDHGRMTSISMRLASYCYSFLQLPVSASAKYEALTELTLYNASLLDDGGRTLGDFVSSSCCPRLRKLGISCIKGLARLAIVSEALETFKLRSTEGLRELDVTAPNLGVLELDDCFGVDESNKARIASSSRRLQEIRIRHRWRRPRPDLKIHDLTSVRRLHLELNMHGQYYVPTMDVGFWLLEKCPSVEHVSVWLDHQRSPPSSVIEGADFTLEGAAPFASVRSLDMTVRAYDFQDCQLVPSIFAVLLRCPCLRSLHIKIFVDDTKSWERSWACSFCDEHQQYTWTDHRPISLESLEDVKLIGFRGADEDIWTL